MTDIDSNRDTNGTRIDQDNEKNTASPIRGGNDAGAPDLDERNRAGAPRRGDDVAQATAEQNEDAILNRDVERDEKNPSRKRSGRTR